MSGAAVLLSTYNGESCLPVLLDSLLSQSRPPDRILVRDDGSTDGTCTVLAEYARHTDRLRWYAGENLGARASFFELLAHAAGTDEPPYEYYALCDQDDKWLPNRLEKGIACVEAAARTAGIGMPVLACSRPRLVDERYQPIRETRRFILPSASFGNALVENICIGCTATFNRALLVAALSGGLPEDVIMHDWWLYLTAAGLGTVTYDPEPSVLYRQHAGNAVGMAATNMKHQMGRARRFIRARGSSKVAVQTAEFLQRLGPVLKPEDRRLAEQFAFRQGSIAQRIALVRNRQLRRQRRGDDVLFRILLLLGHYRAAASGG